MNRRNNHRRTVPVLLSAGTLVALAVAPAFASGGAPASHHLAHSVLLRVERLDPDLAGVSVGQLEVDNGDGPDLLDSSATAEPTDSPGATESPDATEGPKATDAPEATETTEATHAPVIDLLGGSHDGSGSGGSAGSDGSSSGH